ncbi:MAG TPA: fumarylacetoacetate hydrolase family protein [Desulfomonilaceae bacterium]|nr:fumarylacetoacetate hydrolase family protein [Desulfomonilaceae bacterium]
MKRVRFAIDEKIYTGRLVEKRIVPLEGESFPREVVLENVRLLAPCRPSKIVAVGLNYRDHAEELHLSLPEEPLLFLKPSTSIIGPEDTIMLPPQSERVDYEAELAVVIGKQARRITSDRAKDYILGYTCLNDVTARDLQNKDGQWTRAKGFDTFCPLGPWIETNLDPSDLAISLLLNGETKQQSRTSNLIFDVFRLVEFISHIMTLMPGDVIATGTTSGIGPMKDGDTVEVRIEGIGSLINHVSGNSG